MTSRERVLKALNHEQTDRVPLDLGGMACCLLDGVYFKLPGLTGGYPAVQGRQQCLLL